MTDTPALVATDNRFGLGRVGGMALPPDRLAAPYLINQFERFDPAPAALAAAPARSVVAATLIEYRETIAAGRNPIEEERAADEAMRNDGRNRRGRQPGMGYDPMAATAMADDAADSSEPDSSAREMRRERRQGMRAHYLLSVAARFDVAVNSSTPFVERLVHFWANHFAVSIDKIATVGFAGLMEFEAVRPHVLGQFSQLLWAVETHPAMLLYLDQAQSIGPDSPFAQRVGARRRANGRTIGLNENLAREILELHTLGVDGGYAQGDVTELARALTGITMPGLAPGPLRRLFGDNADDDVRFVDALHQPGDRMLMGRRYPATSGDGQPRAMLSHLATHPATARHLSTKLARHFVSDTPPADLVDRLIAAFLEGNGNLSRWYRVLLTAPQAWAPDARKAKTPWDWGVSAARALHWTHMPEPRAIAGLFMELGQPVWRPGSPAGFDDVAASWMAPDALLRRVEAAGRLVLLASGATDPRALAEQLFGPTLTGATREAIMRAESVQQALALLLVSPEFLRR